MWGAFCGFLSSGVLEWSCSIKQLLHGDGNDRLTWLTRARGHSVSIDRTARRFLATGPRVDMEDA